MNGEQMPVPAGMDEQDRAAPVHLRIDRLELGLGDRAVEADDVHVDADAAQLVKAALHLLQCGVDMRQRQHHVGGDALRVAVRQIGVAVVQHLDRFDAFRLVRQIGRMVRRQHLLFDPGRVHQLEPPADVLRRIRERVPRHSALDRQMNRRRKPVAHELAEILRRVMRMHIDDHDGFPALPLFAPNMIRALPAGNKFRPRARGKTGPQPVGYSGCFALRLSNLTVCTPLPH